MTGRAAVEVTPGRMAGLPCIAGTRLTTHMIATVVRGYGMERVGQGWPDLSRTQVLVACWFEARCGTDRALRKAWASWLNVNCGVMWRGDWESVEDPPRADP